MVATKIFEPTISALNAQGRLRHKPGGGSLYDQAEADPQSYINRNSSLWNMVNVRESRIIASRIEGETVIHRAEVIDSDVNCKFILGGTIKNSQVFGQSKVWGSPIIESVQIHDLCVFGDARLVGGWSLDGKLGRIGTGLWVRAPRVVRYEDLQVTVTESVNECAYVACRLHSIRQWLRIGNRIGAAAGWSQWQVDRLRELFLFWLDRPISASQQPALSEADPPEALSRT